MSKIYINITAYANKHNLTLEQAHKEIQPWLFEIGYDWELTSYQGKVSLTFAEYLELNMDTLCIITQCGSESFTESDYDVEWEFVREVSYSEVLDRDIIKEQKYVEFNGKQYDKAKLEKALKMIDESNRS